MLQPSHPTNCTGWLSFSSAASFSSGSGGTDSWTSPGNALASDDSKASCPTLNGTSSHTLKAQGLATTGVPSTATIRGVEVRFERSKTAGSPVDSIVQLLVSGSGTGDNKSAGAAWPAADAYAYYGGDGDLWGLNLTASDINAATFGFQIAASGATQFATTLQVDHMQMRIFYD